MKVMYFKKPNAFPIAWAKDSTILVTGAMEIVKAHGAEQDYEFFDCDSFVMNIRFNSAVDGSEYHIVIDEHLPELVGQYQVYGAGAMGGILSKPTKSIKEGDS